LSIRTEIESRIQELEFRRKPYLVIVLPVFAKY
jgi:hypothetical protein